MAFFGTGHQLLPSFGNLLSNIAYATQIKMIHANQWFGTVFYLYGRRMSSLQHEQIIVHDLNITKFKTIKNADLYILLKLFVLFFQLFGLFQTFRNPKTSQQHGFATANPANDL